MKLPFLLLAGAVALALPGFLLLLRPGRLATATAVALLLLATAFGYAGIQLRAALPPPVPAFVLSAPPG